ncbi:MAG: LysM peptidoglycan-binding domain-containing protein [Opitutales bacterium]
MGLGLASLQAQQQSLSLASLREDVELLSRRVGQLQLNVTALERRNAELENEARQQRQTLASLSARITSFGDTLETRLDTLPARDRQLKAEILKEVSSLIRDLEKDLQRQLERAAPAPAPAPQQPPIAFDDNFPKDGIMHEVQPGETLSAIAQKHGSRVVWIQKANRIADPTKLQAGQEIFIPQEAQ